MEIEVKKVDEMQVAYIPYTGPFEVLPQLLGEVVQWVMNKGLQIVGMPFALYYNSPMEVPPEELKWETGIPFKGEGNEEGRIKIKKIPSQLVLTTIHKGPYDQVAPIYAAIMEYVFKNSYEIAGPPMELYLNDPREVGESETLTEIQQPVTKK
jgi:effector-binding domain-containing protein